MKTVQTVEIIFANTKGKLVSLNIENHWDGHSLSFFYIFLSILNCNFYHSSIQSQQQNITEVVPFLKRN